MSKIDDCSFEKLSERVKNDVVAGAVIGGLIDGVGVVPGAAFGAYIGATRWLSDKLFFCPNGQDSKNSAIENLPKVELNDVGR